MIYRVTIHRADGEILRVEPWSDEPLSDTNCDEPAFCNKCDSKKVAGFDRIMTEEDLLKHLQKRLLG